MMCAVRLDQSQAMFHRLDNAQHITVGATEVIFLDQQKHARGSLQ